MKYLLLACVSATPLLCIANTSSSTAIVPMQHHISLQQQMPTPLVVQQQQQLTIQPTPVQPTSMRHAHSMANNRMVGMCDAGGALHPLPLINPTDKRTYLQCMYAFFKAIFVE